MILPIGDAPNPRGVPIVTWALIAANVAVWALVTLPLGMQRPVPGDPAFAEYLRVVSRALHGTLSPRVIAARATAYDVFVFAHGFRATSPRLADLFVSLFLHAGFMHLAGNMLFLWIYGDNVEWRLGKLRYLLAYLGTGVAATLFHWLSAPDSPLPVIGASGAISGMLGFYFVWFPRNVVRLLWLLPPFIGQVFEVRARVVLGFYLVFDNVLPYLVGGDTTGVAHSAHIGGFVAGVALAWLADRRDAFRRPRQVPDGPPSSEPVAALVDEGRFGDAARAFFAQPARTAAETLDVDRALALSDWLRREGHVDAAAVTLRRARDATARPADRARLELALGELLFDELDQPALAYQSLRAARDLAGDAATRAAAVDALDRIARRQKRPLGRTAPG